jgi:hypothetical protein
MGGVEAKYTSFIPIWRIPHSNNYLEKISFQKFFSLLLRNAAGYSCLRIPCADTCQMFWYWARWNLRTNWEQTLNYTNQYLYAYEYKLVPTVMAKIRVFLNMTPCTFVNRNVAVSIPVGVIRIFHWRNPFDRTMALGSTQPLTEMSTRNIFWGGGRGKGGRCPGLTTFTTFMCRLSWNLGTSTSWNPKGLSRPVTG